MFRREPHAELRSRERSRPDPHHPGTCFIARSYFLLTGDQLGEVELPPGFGEAIVTFQADHPQPMGRVEGRHWWMYRDVIYSTPDRLTRGAVLRLAELARAPRPMHAAHARPSRPAHGAGLTASPRSH